mmetsp:Transcript_9277/g.26396  ORF Transcript_9277/g.26396 Transcript_9277/m.26396 type:complete len:308 (+) Transcript_9277:2524-3447(+)
MVEIRRADCLPHHVPLQLRRRDRKLLLLHDVNHLGSHLSGLPQYLRMQEVPGTPVSPVLVVFPLVVNMQKREVIAFGDKEFLPCRVALLLPVRRAEENRRDAEHGDNCEDFTCAAKLVSHQEHLCEGRVQWELHHLFPQARQVSRVIQSPKNPQLKHGLQKVVLRRRVHEVKVQQVVDFQALQQKDHVAKVCPLNLWNVHLQHLILVRVLREHAVTSSWSSTAGPSGALVHTRSAAGKDLESIHSHLWVVHFHFHVATVHDVQDAIHGEGGLRDVRADDAFAYIVRGFLKDLRLEIRGKLRIHRKDG